MFGGMTIYERRSSNPSSFGTIGALACSRSERPTKVPVFLPSVRRPASTTASPFDAVITSGAARHTFRLFDPGLSSSNDWRALRASVTLPML
jgi:hypothetical protein